MYKSHTYTDEEWTTEPPTETGLYWAFNGAEVSPVDVYLDGSNSRLVCFELGDKYDQVQDVNDFSYWLGPLPVPEPPKP